MEFKYNRYNTSLTPLSSLLVFANISYYPLYTYNLPAIFLVDSFFVIFMSSSDDSIQHCGSLLDWSIWCLLYGFTFVVHTNFVFP